MRAALCPAVLVIGLSALWTPSLRSQSPRQPGTRPISVTLDSGTVARLTWRGDGRQQVQLVTALAPASESIRYCRYPSFACGAGSVNPVQTRPVIALERIEVRHGNHVRRGALWGAAVGILLTAYGVSWMDDAESRVSPASQVGISALMLGGSIGVGALLGSGGHDWVTAGER
jgi:hypothetical protein